MLRVGSKSWTSAAMRVFPALATERCTTPTPERPAYRAAIVEATSRPTGDTVPMPVTTTRFVLIRARSFLRPRRLARGARGGPRGARRSGAHLLLEVIDGGLHGRHLLCILVRDLDVELFFESHDELHGVERVRPQVVDERRLVGHLFGAHTQLILDDLLDSGFDVAGHVPSSPPFAKPQ